MANPSRMVELSDDAQAFAEERVRAGEYASVGDVANAAIQLLEQRDQRFRDIRSELLNAFAEMESGGYLEPTDYGSIPPSGSSIPSSGRT